MAESIIVNCINDEAKKSRTFTRATRKEKQSRVVKKL